MDADLQLSIGARYSILTMIFFIPYIIPNFQPTSSSESSSLQSGCPR
jgi:hypothetical protein